MVPPNHPILIGFGTIIKPSILGVLIPLFLQTSIYKLSLQGGPQKAVISGVVAPISRVKFHPSETHLFLAIYRGYNPTYNW